VHKILLELTCGQPGMRSLQPICWPFAMIGWELNLGMEAQWARDGLGVYRGCVRVQCECSGDSGWSPDAGAWACRRSWLLRRSFGFGVYRGWAGCLGKCIGEVVVLRNLDSTCMRGRPSRPGDEFVLFRASARIWKNCIQNSESCQKPRGISVFVDLFVKGCWVEELSDLSRCVFGFELRGT